MKPLVIVGAGGHGREVLDVVEAMNNHGGAEYEFLGFLDDEVTDTTLLQRRGVAHLGPVALLETLDVEYLIGIGSGLARRRIDMFATSMGRRPASAIHPSATLGSDLRLGPGLVVAAGARITTNVTTGRHVHLNVNATLSHDSVAGDYVTLNPGAHVNGNVVLGDEVMIGSGATVIQGLTVGHTTAVGAGAVVVKEIPAGVTAVGVPARPLPASAPQDGQH